MHPDRRWRTAGVVAAAALVLAACGVEAGTTAAQQAEKDRDEEILDNTLDQAKDLGLGDNSGSITDSEKACLDEAAEDANLDLRELMTAKDHEGRIELFTIFLDCLEDPASHPALLTPSIATLEASIAGLDVTDEEGECLLRYLIDESDNPARTLLTMTGPDDIEIALAGMEACLSDENMAVIEQAEGSGPQEYGDDERFDSMYDDCESGEEMACDLLYMLSSEGSGYEEFAASCAGRVPEADTFCSPDVEVDDSGFSPPDSPGLTTLKSACGDGDFTACDLLQQVAPIGSDFEDFGYTCGDRLPVGAVPDCRTQLGE